MTGGSGPPDRTRVPLVCLVDSPAVAGVYRRWSAWSVDSPFRLVLLDVAKAAAVRHPTDIEGVDGPCGLVASGAAATAAYRLVCAQHGTFPIVKLILLGPPAVAPESDAASPPVLVLIPAGGSASGSSSVTYSGPVDGNVCVRTVSGVAAEPLEAAPEQVLPILMEELWLWRAYSGPSGVALDVPAEPTSGKVPPATPQPRDLPATQDSDPAAAQVADTATALTVVPNTVRRFDVPQESVFTRFRVTPALLAVAITAGLPHASNGDVRLFDRMDLTNLALCPALRTPQRAVLRTWRRLLDGPISERRAYELAYHAPCPAPGHSRRCTFELRLPGDRIKTVRANGSGTDPLVRTHILLTGDWPELPPAASDLVAELADIRFMRLPTGLRRDVEFVRRHRMGDCAGIARLTVEEGRRRAIPVRAVYGLIVAAPYATAHHWPETLVDGRWVPCDPGLHDALVRWGVLAKGAWPANRSLGPLLVGLSTRYGRAVVHGPFVANTSFHVGRVQPV